MQFGRPADSQPPSRQPASLRSVTERTLPEVKVESSPENSNFRTDTTRSGTRPETPLRDIPQFINIVPQALIRSQGATTLQDALRNVPGISYGAAEGGSQSNQQVFLSAPEDYDGGELLVEDTYGVHSVKLPAGDMVIYPATSLHRVTPVTRGTRVSSFFWIESMIRDDAKRALLFDMDMALVRLNQQTSGHPSLVTLTGCYHNLLRMWGEA